MILTSKNNPLIKETVALKDKKFRKQLGLFLVEGVKMTKEALQSGCEVERIFVCEPFDGDVSFLDGVAEEKIVYVSPVVMQALSDEKTPQGVLCRVKISSNSLQPPKNSCLILDGVADPGNVGTIIRTANAAGYDEVYLTHSCADPYSPKSVRASMSGIFFTHVYQAERTQILQTLADVPVIVADMGGENVFTFTAPNKFALVIGNEANGVSVECRERATFTVKIPMRATQESLNAGVSAGILAYALKKGEFLE
ncbi:MAG: RNA methyltransferase [Clostridia bacterium]|nr:RNA methyltransferase [Clostridia bacterium]